MKKSKRVKKIERLAKREIEKQFKVKICRRKKKNN